MTKIIDPYLIMRKDGNRVIVYPKDDAAFNKDFGFAWKMLHPRGALILSLFDGTRTEDEVVAAWTELNNWDVEQSREDVQRALKKYDDLMIEVEAIPLNFQPPDPTALVCSATDYDTRTSRLNIPISMLYLPTMFCGHQCRYCYADITHKRDPNELTLREIEGILDQCHQLQFAGVSLSGGDPFLRSDSFEIIEMLYERGFHEDIPTKSALTEKQIRRLTDIGVHNIQLSLDSPLDADLVEYHTGKEDYFNKIIQTLHLLGEAGITVGITCVLTKHNVHSVPQIVEYFGDLGFVHRLSFAPVSASIYRNFPDLYPEPGTYEVYEQHVKEMKPKYSHMFLKLDSEKDVATMSVEERKEWYDARATCSGGRFAFVLLPDGRTTLCEELYHWPDFVVGDLRKQSIIEMWTSPEMMAVMQPDKAEFVGSPCHDCSEFDDCHLGKGRCWKRALKAYKQQPNAAYMPDPYCPHAPQVVERQV